ncbi:MAG: Ig-like domain-containing protein [bacterium]
MKQWLALAVVALAVGIACDQADTTKPTCAVVEPAAGDSLEPGSITIKAVATDDKEMKLVEFYVGNRKVGEDATAAADTFEAIWDAGADTTGGTRLLKAIAFDAADNFTEATASVVLRRPPEPPPQDSINPNVRLRAPVRGDTVELDTILLKAWAVDNTELEKVEFYVDGTKVGEDLAGVSDTFTFDWDASGATPGSLLLIKATAIDTAGNTKDDTLSVRVSQFTGPTYHNGDVTSSQTWSVQAGPHIVTAFIDIKDGARLTIEPGARVLFDAGAGLTIGSGGNGELLAVGTADSMIQFSARTTARSDTTPGYWKGIHFYGGAGAACRLSYCDIAFGGEASAGAVATYGGSRPTVDHCRIRSSAGMGLTLDDQGGHVVGFEFNRITSCASYAAETYPNLVRHFGIGNALAPNATEGVLVHTGPVDSSMNWRAVGTPYVIEDSVWVGGPAGPVLTVDGGAGLKFSRQGRLLIGARGQPGALYAEGELSPIRFTSVSSHPGPGDWGGIVFGPDAIDAQCVLTLCTFEYGGDEEIAPGMIVITNAVPSITTCIIQNSLSWGIYLDGTEYPDPEELLQQNTFRNNQSGDVRRP